MVVAVLGAECTGKTQLVRELARALAAEGHAVATVSEWLREWCSSAGRTPEPREQWAIAREQHARISAAVATEPDLVLCDTTALVTAAYSRILFDDTAIEPGCVDLHRQAHISLLCEPDLPWVADGLQRDGAHSQAPLHAALLNMLDQHRLPWRPIRGAGGWRLQMALDSVRQALDRADHPGLEPRSGQAGA